MAELDVAEDDIMLEAAEEVIAALDAEDAMLELDDVAVDSVALADATFALDDDAMNSFVTSSPARHRERRPLSE